VLEFGQNTNRTQLYSSHIHILQSFMSNALDSFSEILPATDLTALVAGTHDLKTAAYENAPQYQRIFEQIVRAFYRQQARHVILISERGVGNAAILTELARRGLQRAHAALAERTILLLNARNVPPEVSRQVLYGTISELLEQPNLIVGIEGFAKLLYGAHGSNKNRLASILPQLRCHLIGLLSPREYQDLVADDAEFQEHFTRIDVPEPDVPLAVSQLSNFARGLERQYSVEIADDVIKQSAVLAANYIFGECLPGKAVKLLQRACEELAYERAELHSTRRHITADDIIRAVSEASGVPENTLRGIAEQSDYERSLGETIFGQMPVVKEVASELGLIKTGLNDPTKPASVLMFVGQTGTGKTEMAKALARLYSNSKKLKTYTLGNFVEAHSVAGIIGVPPGYVGHDAGGQLVNDLNADPYGVFLLDEADKAHPDVLQPFLNLFDEGWIVDQRGVKAYARHAIFILTTNVGQKMISDMAGKGQSAAEITERMKEALSQIKHGKANRPVFSPEFLARIKRILVFHPLDQAAITGITRKLITEMQTAWRTNRGKGLEIAEELVADIAAQGHTQNEKSKGKEGGRIIRKLISDLVETRIQRAISDRPEEYYRAATVKVTGRCKDMNAPEIEVAFTS
jgi:ATP-dependent Clp protease ATP-binding subunit ClpA